MKKLVYFDHNVLNAMVRGEEERITEESVFRFVYSLRSLAFTSTIGFKFHKAWAIRCY
jgi:hypothetical protein